MRSRHINVTKRARYYQIGEANSSIKKVWMVFHGYAMLSEFFIKKFEILNDGETLIIAPEALNRFYITENFSRVGASWMTKLERENDIVETTNILNHYFKRFQRILGIQTFQLKVLGFSQGSATACRWIFSANNKTNNFIVWAGDIPKDCLKTITDQNGIL
jgi:predicted esterase